MMTYDSYKASQTAWMGEVPEHWKLEKAKWHFTLRNERGNENPVLLAATQKNGMYPQDKVEGVVKVAEGTDVQQFRTVHKNDFVISLRSFQGGFERSDYEGVCSPAYQVFYSDEAWNDDYLRYLFKDELFIDAMNALTVGIREGRNIKYEDFANSILAIPPIEEQKSIAAYLNEKIGCIDSVISEANVSIEEYKSWKASIIYEAVTKGLDPNVEMKDSGVDIIGSMPASWKLCRLKYLCDIMTGNQDTQDADENGIYPFYVRSPNIQRSNKYTFEGEGVLMAGDGAGAGRVFHHAFGKYAIHQRVYCLHNFKNVNVEYFLYFISELFKKVMDKGSVQSTVPSIRLPMIQDFLFCIPSEGEQDQIVKLLNNRCASINSIISEKEALVSDLESYKKSLIFEVVTGKRRVV